MNTRAFLSYITLSIAISLSACSNLAVVENESLWAPQHFSKSTTPLPQIEDLFRLPSDLEETIVAAKLRNAPIQNRVNFLLELVYSDHNRPFLYEGYHSTSAAETWSKKRGDCLSLSILAYAIGKRLDLPIAVQEVTMPVNFDRRGQVEYLNGHVNAIILNPFLRLNEKMAGTGQGYMLIDFDPAQFTQRRGKILEEKEILAHFYNNLGVEAMLKNQKDLAYTYFKSSIQEFPKHTASYTNLSVLYQRSGLSSNALRVLEFAYEQDRESILVLRQLSNLYNFTGQAQKASAIQLQIKSVQEEDPYYWIGRGLFELEHKNYANAITYLERAQKFTNGFEEIHQALAVAYLNTKDLGKAKRQLELLAEINVDNPKLRHLKGRLAAK